MNALRAVLFALFFYPGTAVAVTLAFPAALVGPKAVMGVTHGWARWHRWCAAICLGVRSRIEGHPPRGTVLVASKHQSMFETIEMLLWLDRPAAEKGGRERHQHRAGRAGIEKEREQEGADERHQMPTTTAARRSRYLLYSVKS